jgi:hypothetical protein
MTKSKILAEIQKMIMGLAESERRDVYKFIFHFIDNMESSTIDISIKQFKRR